MAKAVRREPEPDILVPALIFATIGLILLFACLLLNVVYKKAAEYRHADSTIYSSYSSYPNPPSYDDYSQNWREVQAREAQLRKNITSTFERTMRDTQDQEELQRLQRELLKFQKKPAF